jgi:hypothetical protein
MGDVLGGSRNLETIRGRVLASKEGRLYGSPTKTSERRHDYVVEYTLPSGETKRAELKQAWTSMNSLMRDVAVGETVSLLLNPRSGKVEFDLEDPTLGYSERRGQRARKKAEQAQFENVLRGGDATGSPALGHPQVEDEARFYERLNDRESELRDQLERGVVSQAAFDDEMAKIDEQRTERMLRP